MEIGKKLRDARLESQLTQEQVAEKIHVSRQSISNWENEKNYPDIVSLIQLSDLYDISLDVLLKGDDSMIQHLDTSTNVVKSNAKLFTAIGVYIILIILFFCSMMLKMYWNQYVMIILAGLSFASVGTIFYQLIKKI